MKVVGNIKHDFEMIVHKLDKDLPYINLYPIGDLHVGSPQFDRYQWLRWKDTVVKDPYGFVVIVGDMMDNGLKDSKTDSYQATIRPNEQKDWLEDEFEPIKKKILGAVDGNHEGRSSRHSDDYPLYDVMCRLGNKDLFRENIAFIKINLGQRTLNRQCSYGVVLQHGVSETKGKKFSLAVDGMDIYITGHTHTPTDEFPVKYVMDLHNEIVREVGMKHITVPSFLRGGGYGVRGQYLPQDNTIFPYLTLYGDRKKVNLTWT